MRGLLCFSLAALAVMIVAILCAPIFVCRAGTIGAPPNRRRLRRLGPYRGRRMASPTFREYGPTTALHPCCAPRSSPRKNTIRKRNWRIAQPSGRPPLLSTRYNSNLQIVRPGYVAIEAEEIHDVRIVLRTVVRIYRKVSASLIGDSVGHWEGNTLVVDTTNFTDLNPFPGAQNLKLSGQLYEYACH